MKSDKTSGIIISLLTLNLIYQHGGGRVAQGFIFTHLHTKPHLPRVKKYQSRLFDVHGTQSSTRSSSVTTHGDDIATSRLRKENEHTTPGIPHNLSSLSVNDPPLTEFRYPPPSSNPPRPFNIQRLSSKPDIFLLRNFLTPYECHVLTKDYSSSLHNNNQNDSKNNNNMSQAETLNNQGQTVRKSCLVRWLRPSDASHLVSQLAQTVGDVLLGADIMAYEPYYEDLQVLFYDEGGEYQLHHDGNNRILTVIYYLNGVAGTWFPLARRGDDVGLLRHKGEALALTEGLVPGRDGLVVLGYGDGVEMEGMDDDLAFVDEDAVVRVSTGDVLAFYNYVMEDDGARMDWRAIHAGLPVSSKKGKWIANHWFCANYGLFAT